MHSAQNSHVTHEGQYQPDRSNGTSTQVTKEISVCLVGGKTIIRSALHELLRNSQIDVAGDFSDESAFAEAVSDGATADYDLILVLAAAGCANGSERIGELLSTRPDGPPVVVLCDDLSRGGIYNAIRMGAKGYVTLDSEPDELLRTIMLAVEGKMHLSHDAAELMLTDITGVSRGPQSTADSAAMPLSPRETEVVELLCDGLSSKEIASRLHLSPKTIENHRYNIYRKCHVESIAGLFRYAVHQGIVSL